MQRTGILSSPKAQAALQTVHCYSLLFKHVNGIVNKMLKGLYQLMIISLGQLMKRLNAQRDLGLLICIALPGLVSRWKFRNIHFLYLGGGKKGMLGWFCREADTVGLQGRREGNTGPQIGLKSNKGKWRELGKVLEGRIFLVFVTKSDGMLWWHTWEKRAPIALKQICRALRRDWPCRLPADCLPWEHRWVQCLSSITAARRWGGKPL